MFPRLVSAAAETFIAHGFQRTQMQDVADVLGVAKGTVYGYVENKDALLGAAPRYADGVVPPPGVGQLPVPASAERESAALVAERLGNDLGDLRVVGGATALGSRPATRRHRCRSSHAGRPARAWTAA
ncbi:helix-turn-helix domain-containing protein [Lentzea sp. NPDC004782]|uniref:helix-turn-helix domain-containing protein n=1 Tax=Lentzea sp. NPDC004782 TaxID=3154458 RepID=UPI0033B20215